MKGSSAPQQGPIEGEFRLCRPPHDALSYRIHLDPDQGVFTSRIAFTLR